MSSWSRFIKRLCTQTAVYWGEPTSDGMGGKTFTTPSEIKVRWEEETEIAFSKGEEEEATKGSITARVIYSGVLSLNGYLFLGEVSDIDGDTGNPVGIRGAFKIIDKRNVPLLNGRDFINEYIV